MRNLLAILLLLSLSCILVHEMIPHHHHDGNPVSYRSHPLHQEANPDDCHEGHSHPFPAHQHLAASFDFLSPRILRLHMDGPQQFSWMSSSAVMSVALVPEPPINAACLSPPIVLYSWPDPWLPAANPLRAPPLLS